MWNRVASMASRSHFDTGPRTCSASCSRGLRVVECLLVCVTRVWGARSALAEARRQRLRRGIVLLRLRACACCYRAVFDGANAVLLFRSLDVDVVCPTAAFNGCERRRIRCAAPKSRVLSALLCRASNPLRTGSRHLQACEDASDETTSGKPRTELAR